MMLDVMGDNEDWEEGDNDEDMEGDVRDGEVIQEAILVGSGELMAGLSGSCSLAMVSSALCRRSRSRTANISVQQPETGGLSESGWDNTDPNNSCIASNSGMESPLSVPFTLTPAQKQCVSGMLTIFQSMEHPALSSSVETLSGGTSTAGRGQKQLSITWTYLFAWRGGEDQTEKRRKLSGQAAHSG
ncbi:hypothetical protein E2C01_011352 [Portunus trituberculatus]|uniref:Uncharacterized protein n=1 Tax=Portunus trituberculatus TaxID=210409 RepID=A0A5B7DBH1_PORTR|nr:hypothetical protein [Portunus trituberculatus]